MDPTRDGPPEDARIAAIRLDIEMARARIVKTIDALEYKTDMPARLADVLSNTAASFTARFLQRIPSPRRTSTEGKEAAVEEPGRAQDTGTIR